MSTTKERRRRQVPAVAQAAAAASSRGYDSSTSRNRGTGPKLFSRSITREALQEHFHLPMEEAAHLWGVSTTIVKRVCRTFGIERWPYRQIQSARKRIDTLEEKLRSGSRGEADQDKINAGICAMKIKICELLADPNPQHKRATPQDESRHQSPPPRNSKSARCAVAAMADGGATPRGVARGLEGGGTNNAGRGRKGGTIDATSASSSSSKGAARSLGRKTASRAAARAIEALSAAPSVTASSPGGVHSSKGHHKRQAPSPARVPIAATVSMTTSVTSNKRSFYRKRIKLDGGGKAEFTNVSTARTAALVGTLDPARGACAGALRGIDAYRHERATGSIMPDRLPRNPPLSTAAPPPYAVQAARRWDASPAGAIGGSMAGVDARQAAMPSAYPRERMGNLYEYTTHTSGGEMRGPAGWAVGHGGLGWCGAERAHPAPPCVPRAPTPHFGIHPLQPAERLLYKEVDAIAGATLRTGSFSSDTTADFSDETCVSPISPPPLPARSWGDGHSGDVDGHAVSLALDQALDEIGLESALMLDIPDVGSSGGDSTSSWPPLSGGSYLNTDDAFAAFACAPGEFVPGAW